MSDAGSYNYLPEMSAEQVAAELNRVGWRGREDWLYDHTGDQLYTVAEETAYGVRFANCLPEPDARAIVNGLQAEAEVARLGGVCPHCHGRADLPPGHIERCYCLPALRDMQKRNVELEGQLAEAQRQRDLYVDLKLGQQQLAEELHTKGLELLTERDRALAALREIQDVLVDSSGKYHTEVDRSVAVSRIAAAALAQPAGATTEASE